MAKAGHKMHNDVLDYNAKYEMQVRESTRTREHVTEHARRWGEGTSLPSRRIFESHPPPRVRALLRDPLPMRAMWQGGLTALDKPGTHDLSQVIKVNMHRESLWRAGTLDQM